MIAHRAVVDDDEGRWVLIVEDDEGNVHRFRMDDVTTDVLNQSLAPYREHLREKANAYADWVAAGRPGHYDAAIHEGRGPH